MQKLVSALKSQRWGQLFLGLALGLIVCLTTACNPGNLQGARPNNPPVQMGGQNNPYKQGGDGYTKYNFSSDPNVADTVE
jgi:hypothetical protein